MPKNRSDYSRERAQFIRKFQAELVKRVKSVQSSLYYSLLDIITSLNTDKDGIIRLSDANIRRGERVGLLIENFGQNTVKNRVIGWLVRRFETLNKLNRQYFRKVDVQSKDVHDRARELTMRRWGIDVKNETIVRGSYFDSLIRSEPVAQEILQRFQSALAGNTSLSDFQKAMRDDLVAEGGNLGAFERYFYRNTFDILQEHDRQVGKVYADDLQLNYLIWNHTTKDTSTDFCNKRQGRIFTREFAARWDSELNWKGKKPNNDVFIDGHGYNCRTSIDWISDELAERLIKSRGVNEYNF